MAASTPQSSASIRFCIAGPRNAHAWSEEPRATITECSLNAVDAALDALISTFSGSG